MERRLAAILVADVEGYSRLMGADEEGTLERLAACRSEVVDPTIVAHRGRIVKSTGDGLLVEFASVLDAVRCAVHIQKAMAQRDGAEREDRRLRFRIGINLGDIIARGDDIFGDGVNVAARLEGLAEPGGICVSGKVRDEIADRLDFTLWDMGAQSVKNIAQPVPCYRLDLEARHAAPPALPDKPSIAVLPFTNMSGDPEQEYFADGISEDLITALSCIRWLFVIARNSSFAYKSRVVDIKRVGRELGVRYVLEGSVRRLGNRVRITAQLVDSTTGAHLWAERYDRELTDIFALQDEIAQSVAAAIEPRLLAAEGLRSSNRRPEDLDAWDRVARALSRYWRFTNSDTQAAVEDLKEAVRRHPDFAQAHSVLAFTLMLGGHFGWLEMYDVSSVARQSALRAAVLDDRDPWAHLALGYLAFVERRTDEAAAEHGRAIELNPNFAAAHGFLGFALAFDGRSDQAIAPMQRAMRMSPFDPLNHIFCGGIAVAYYLDGRYEEAVAWSHKAIAQRSESAGPQRILCASLAQAGRMDEARATLALIRELQPHVSLAWVERMVPYTPEQMPRFLDGLRKAGLT